MSDTGIDSIGGMSPAGTVAANKRGFWAYLHFHRRKYILLIPGIAFFVIFRYIPLAGNVMAFQNFNFAKGVFGSPWIGLGNFRFLFGSEKFFQVLRNSILISLYKLVWGFPFPIFIALLLNELRSVVFKRTIQTIIYLPHFISWPIMGGLVIAFLSPDRGIVNVLIKALGAEPIFFLASTDYFRGVLVATSIWKEAGWGTIIYLAALAGIDPQLYEAAIIDGANRFRCIRHITLPGIASTIVILLILRMGHILENGFDQVFILYNPSVYDVGDVLETYVYRMGLVSGRYSFSTAAGMFQSIIGFIMIVSVNWFAKRVGETSVF
jgi:putative aldouronate transport system permease protein